MYVVSTQHVENYGAHCEDGKFSSGNSYWKFKGGQDYIVKDVDRPADAMAFVMAAFSMNSIMFKEFPTEVKTYDEWNEDLPDDQEYRKFLREQVLVVSPLTGNDFKKGWLNV